VGARIPSAAVLVAGDPAVSVCVDGSTIRITAVSKDGAEGTGSAF